MLAGDPYGQGDPKLEDEALVKNARKNFPGTRVILVHATTSLAVHEKLEAIVKEKPIRVAALVVDSHGNSQPGSPGNPPVIQLSNDPKFEDAKFDVGFKGNLTNPDDV